MKAKAEALASRTIVWGGTEDSVEAIRIVLVSAVNDGLELAAKRCDSEATASFARYMGNNSESIMALKLAQAIRAMKVSSLP